MDNFESYYNCQFRSDIQKFFSTIPEASRFHEDKEQKDVFSIQYERLTQDKDHLNFLATNQAKVNFGVALFFIVLVDEVCYSHYQNYYDSFKQITRYPKFIGNCLSMCRYHLPPSDVFIAMNYKRNGSSSDYLVFYDTFFNAIPIMEKETLDFFKTHLPAIDGKEFWEKCIAEFPYKMIK